MDKYKTYLLAQKKSLVYYNYMKLYYAWLKKSNIAEEEAHKKGTIVRFFAEHDYSINALNNFIKAGRHFSKEFLEQETDWVKVKLLKPEKRIPNYLTEEDLEKAKRYLITYHGKILKSVKVHALLDFLFYSGARKSEVLNLKRADFDLKDNSAKVYGKGRKERIIYYPETVKKEIKKYFKSEPETVNAFNITKTQLSYIPRVLKKYFKDKNITVHLFRHSGGRCMIRKGVPLSHVQKILGHSSINTTMIYVAPDGEEVNSMYKEKFNGN